MIGPGRLCVCVRVSVYGLYVCACGCARARVRSCAHVQTEPVEGLGCHLVCVCVGGFKLAIASPSRGGKLRRRM